MAAIVIQSDLPIGQRLSDTRFKAVTDVDGILEFKADQLRLFCFFTRDRRIILANGIIKKSDNDRRYRAAAARAAELRQQFLSEAEPERGDAVREPARRKHGGRHK